jgi:hypothetical protein
MSSPEDPKNEFMGDEFIIHRPKPLTSLSKPSQALQFAPPVNMNILITSCMTHPTFPVASSEQMFGGNYPQIVQV